ncbi:MAG TPA: helix-turn-helix domain-containing protein [Mycobacteriales bacterium]|nr:helix-turn-helix domain-containing protein [Mycobacteriales bacterium]
MTAGPRRADAQRNRQRLLVAARAVFDEQGIDAPLDDIARRAGVGNATMYRHFGNRRELALAVYADEVTTLCDRGSALLAAPSPGDALFDWLLSFVEHVATKGDLAVVDADEPPGTGSELFAHWHDVMHRTAAALLERARHAGAVRADIDPTDLLLLASGIARTGADPHRVRRLLDLVRRGSEAHPGRPDR